MSVDSSERVFFSRCTVSGDEELLLEKEEADRFTRESNLDAIRQFVEDDRDHRDERRRRRIVGEDDSAAVEDENDSLITGLGE